MIPLETSDRAVHRNAEGAPAWRPTPLATTIEQELFSNQIFRPGQSSTRSCFEKDSRMPKGRCNSVALTLLWDLSL